ncbi:ATP-binding protein [Streptomyces ochraceiscleroticus]|uniref:ATP-binding protein n=1 Tax=Streptomyces ochraceiscleroticus TaxID=47761 RepID=A0ABW1MKN3_9ACTN|nr:tetratricopeptide repeat protein [Streptomyces ochraceiscleroticus]
MTLTGIGGVGKTRTALRAAAEIAGDFRDGAWFVELSGLQDSELLMHAVARVLCPTDHTTRPMEEVLADHLSTKHLLLILDTCEHLVDACADLADLLLRAAPRLHLLVTSRQPLSIPGEQAFLLEPLPVTEDAVALFAQRALAARPGFTLAGRNRATVERICTRLDGIPLAIELAAGRLRTESLEDLLDRLDDRFQLLVNEKTLAEKAAGDPGGPLHSAFRHDTLRTAIGWSHELCRPHERLLWARLSVFIGDFSRTAVERVCGDDILEKAEIGDLLTGLVEKSLLVRERGPDGERFRQLDTVRAYGAEWLRRLGEELPQRTRHLDWCQAFAERGERNWFGPGQAAVFHATRREHAQLFAALDFALSTPGHEQAGLRLAGTLWFYWVGCGLLGDGRYWLDRARALGSGPTRERLKVLWVGGYVAILQGDSEAALAMLTECRSQALRTGDDTAYAYATHRLGCAALMRDDHRTAQEFFETSRSRYAELGELNSNVMMAQVELAMALAFQGDLEAAVGLCAEARSICESHGERWAKAYALYVLSYAAWTTGRYEEAAELAQECLVINYEFRDLVGVVLPIELISLFRASSGHSFPAAMLHGAARRIWRKVGLPLFGSAYFNAPHEAAVALARKALGDDQYAAAVEGGIRLPLGEAVASALVEVDQLLRKSAPEMRFP